MTRYSNGNIYHTNSFNYQPWPPNKLSNLNFYREFSRKMFSSTKSNFPHKQSRADRKSIEIYAVFRVSTSIFNIILSKFYRMRQSSLRKSFSNFAFTLSYLIFVAVGKYENRLCSVCAMKYGKVVRLPDEYLSWRAYEKARWIFKRVYNTINPNLPIKATRGRSLFISSDFDGYRIAPNKWKRRLRRNIVIAPFYIANRRMRMEVKCGVITNVRSIGFSGVGEPRRKKICVWVRIRGKCRENSHINCARVMRHEILK